MIRAGPEPSTGGRDRSNDPEFQALRGTIATDVEIVTEPPGAIVYVKPYTQPDAEWEQIVETPIEAYRGLR